MRMNVIDDDGIWVINRSEFRMPDAESGNIYEPGVPTRVKDTQWRKDRGDLIVEVDDPLKAKVETVKDPGLAKEAKPSKR